MGMVEGLEGGGGWGWSLDRIRGYIGGYVGNGKEGMGKQRKGI